MVRWLLDLVFVAILAFMAGVAMVALDGILRVALTLPLILFAPGYALLSALFPEGTRPPNPRGRQRQPWGGGGRGAERGRQTPTDDDTFPLENLDRIALSVALSLALVALVIFGLNFTIGFGPRRIAIMVFGITGSALIISVSRRLVLDPDERYTIGFSTDSIPMGGVFGVMFAVSLLVLAASVGLAGMLSPTSDPYSAVYYGAENETSGNFTADAGKVALQNRQPVTIAFENGEGSAQTYTTVVVLETVENGAVTQANGVDRFTTSVGDGETKRVQYDPPDEGGDRVAFYVYKGQPSGEISRATAFRVLQGPLPTDDDSQSRLEPADTEGSN